MKEPSAGRDLQQAAVRSVHRTGSDGADQDRPQGFHGNFRNGRPRWAYKASAERAGGVMRAASPFVQHAQAVRQQCGWPGRRRPRRGQPEDEEQELSSRLTGGPVCHIIKTSQHGAPRMQNNFAKPP